MQKPAKKKYQGLYPQWSAKNPIHIIGHSMGGQTARMLDYLLRTAVRRIFMHLKVHKPQDILMRMLLH